MENEHTALIHLLTEGNKDLAVGDGIQMCTLVLLLIAIKLYKHYLCGIVDMIHFEMWEARYKFTALQHQDEGLINFIFH